MRPISSVWRPLAFLPVTLSGIRLKSERDCSAQEEISLLYGAVTGRGRLLGDMTASPPRVCGPPGPGPLGRAHLCRPDSPGKKAPLSSSRERREHLRPSEFPPRSCLPAAPPGPASGAPASSPSHLLRARLRSSPARPRRPFSCCDLPPTPSPLPCGCSTPCTPNAR